MQLIILAGGKGTRLAGLTKETPKPMLKVADKTLLEHQIELAKSVGIKDIFILSGYLADSIVDYFKNGEDFGVNITHIIEPYPLGTAGSVKMLEHLITERFLIFYGDVMMDMDLERLLDFDRSKMGIATLLAHPNDHPYDSDLIEADETDQVTNFLSKPHPDNFYYSNLVNAAVYVFSPEIFKYIPFKKSDFGKHIFPDLLTKNEALYVYKTPEYIKDMGTPDRLEKVTGDYLSGKVKRRNIANKQKAVFLDRDGTINVYVDNLSRIEDFALIDKTTEAIKGLNKSDYLSIVTTNQPMIAKGFLTKEGLSEIHKKMETLLGNQRAYVDDIFYCPHHPDKGFEGEVAELKITCSCRKPATGMIDEAVKKYNIDTNQSFFVGDTTSDMLTAHNAGLKSVLVRTGQAGRDTKYKVNPDFVFQDLFEFQSFLHCDYEKYLEKAAKALESFDVLKKRVILVGGLSRSGKSTFAKMLQIILEKKNIKSKLFSLDNFIVDIRNRTPGMTVKERFRVEKITESVKKLIQTGMCPIPFYDEQTREVKEEADKFELEKNEVLIIEGVTALAIDDLQDLSSASLYIETDEQRRKERFMQLYRFKGLQDNEIEELYKQREEDEVQIIKEAGEQASIKISL